MILRFLFSSLKEIQKAKNSGRELAQVRLEPGRQLQLAKLMQLRGVCSRRKAEELISRGLVRVQGKKASRQEIVQSDAAVRITKPAEVVRFYEKTAKIWKFYKPRGCVCDRNDALGRKTIYDYLGERVDPNQFHLVGRLDYSSEGLMIMTDNPTLSALMESRESRLQKRYRVRVNGRMNERKLEIIGREGLLRVKIENMQATNTWLYISTVFGEYRDIRLACRRAALRVNRLVRVSLGGYQLRNLPSGEFAEVALRRELGRLLVEKVRGQWVTKSV